MATRVRPMLTMTWSRRRSKRRARRWHAREQQRAWRESSHHLTRPCLTWQRPSRGSAAHLLLLLPPPLLLLLLLLLLSLLLLMLLLLLLLVLLLLLLMLLLLLLNP